MSEIKWIKITTGMFEDEKIKMIESMPESDMILVIWVKLLTLAGRKNMNGYIFLTENIPYTDEMLSTLFNRPLNTIRLALETFKNFSMIEFGDNGFIKIANWEKHQNVGALEKIRENNRLRVQRFRENQKQISAPNDCNVTETLCNDTDKNREEKNRLERDKNREEKKKENIHAVIQYLNTKAEKSFKATTKAHHKHINARFKEGYTLDDFKKVIDNKVVEWKGRITRDGQNMENYLRPQTLFGTKFESYLNQKPRIPKKLKTINEYSKEFDFDMNEV